MSESKFAELVIPVKGYATTGPKDDLKPWEFKRRACGTNDVHIQIKYAGICHSDIHTARGDWGIAKYPCVPGHEILGEVVEVGSGVTKHKKGDIVGVGCMVNSCKSCSSCKEGVEQYCNNGFIGTYNSVDPDTNTNTLGGYSTAITVNEDFVLKINPSVDLAGTTPLLCAGITLYSPLAHWKAGPGKKIAVMGLGGLGHVGVKIAAAMGADVTVLSQSLSKKDDALKFGATSMYATSDPETFTKLAGSFDLILNTISAHIDLPKYINLLKRDGTMVLLGAPPENLSVNAFNVIFGRRSVAGSLIGGIKETQDMLDFCAKHKIVADIEMIKADQINEAYQRMIDSKVRYRFVIDASTF